MSYRIVIHTGPWKTGSSALQQFFYTNRDRLLANQVFYPTGQIIAQSQVEIPNFFTKELSRFMTLEDAINFDLKTLVRNYLSELTVNRAKVLLLSSEDFSNFDAGNYLEMINFFSEEFDFELELIYFDFEPKERLSSYVNQYVRQGEFVDESSLAEIFARIKLITPQFEAATRDISAHLHRINYNDLENSVDIYVKILEVILGEPINWNLHEWAVPTNGQNISISSETLKQLNDFNKLNIEGRPFDESCPVMFTSAFPFQRARFTSYISLLFASAERDSAVAERDSAVAERDSAVAERDSAVAERDSAVAERDAILNSTVWRILRPYRKLRDQYNDN
jgi:hypothetical protein